MPGTLHVLKRSSLVGTLSGGLFSFSKIKEICIRTGQKSNQLGNSGWNDCLQDTQGFYCFFVLHGVGMGRRALSNVSKHCAVMLHPCEETFAESQVKIPKYVWLRKRKEKLPWAGLQSCITGVSLHSFFPEAANTGQPKRM